MNHRCLFRQCKIRIHFLKCNTFKHITLFNTVLCMIWSANMFWLVFIHEPQFILRKSTFFIPQVSAERKKILLRRNFARKDIYAIMFLSVTLAHVAYRNNIKSKRLLKRYTWKCGFGPCFAKNVRTFIFVSLWILMQIWQYAHERIF